MAFMEKQIVYGEWYEVDGPCGTEFIPADLVGDIRRGFLKIFSTRWDEDWNDDPVSIPIPKELADYCGNQQVYNIQLRTGWGARMSAPGYLDCTDWSLHGSEQEAGEYLDEMYGDEEDNTDEEDS